MKRTLFIALSTAVLLSLTFGIYSCNVAKGAKAQAVQAESYAQYLENEYAHEDTHEYYAAKGETKAGNDISFTLSELEFNTITPGDYVPINPGTLTIDYLSQRTIRVKVISMRDVCSCND
jgi:hypothetical protein